MSRLRRLVTSDRYFFVTCNLRDTRTWLESRDFEVLARPSSAELFFNSAAFSLAMESIKVSSTRQINAKRKEAGQLWQGRFFDRALRTVKEYGRAIEYIHWNPVKRGLVKRPGEWVWSSYAEYAVPGEDARKQTILRIDRVRIPSDERTRI
jgi:hypothetical protein